MIFMSISVCFSAYAVGEDKVTAGEISFTGSGGEEIYSFEAGSSVNVSCSVTNNSVRKTISLFVGLYKTENDGDKLVKTDKQSLIFAANQNYTLTDVFRIPANTDESYYLKAFVMNDALEPYTYPGVLKAAVDGSSYFADTPSKYRNYVPGIIRPDEGTIQFTVTPDRPASELGNAYDMLFTVSSAVNEGSAVNNILALCIPTLSETRTDPTLQFVVKNRSTASYLEYPLSNLNYIPGNSFNIAITWKTGGSMYMYGADSSNVIQLGSTTLYAPMTEDLLAYTFTVDKDGPFHISDIMISSKQLSQSQISKTGAFNSSDSNVTLFATDNLTNTTIKKSAWNQSGLYNTLIPAFRSSKQVFYSSEDIFYPVIGVNHSGSDKNYTVNLSVSDLDGNALFTKTASLKIPADSKYHVTELPLPEIADAGLYNINTRITAQDGTYRDYSSRISVIPDTSSSPDGDYSTYYGHHIGVSNEISVFEKQNVTATRMWLSEFVWNNLEPVQNGWQWQRMDDYVDRMEAAGIEMIGVLGYPSRWASKEPSTAEETVSGKTEYRPARWKPKSYSEWENYVSTVVDRYKGRIKYWEVYNEVNFHPPYHTAAFSGTTEEYAELLGIAYSAAKAADPNCRILISGWSAPSGAVDSQMPLEFTKSQYNTGYYDIYNVHGYSGVNAVSSWLSAYRTARPGIEAFMTEEFPMQLGTDTARAFAAVTTPLDFLKAGYNRYFHFAMYGQDGVFFSPDTNSPTEAYQSSGVLQANLRKCDTYDGNYTGISGSSGILNLNMRFTRRDGKILSILGSSGVEFELTVSGDIVSCFDLYGNEITPVTQDGVTTISTKNIAYIISNGALTVSNVHIVDNGEIVKNGGFEFLDGDVGTAGAANCTPTDWNYHKLNANGVADNSAGNIRISTGTKNSGNYSLWIRNNSAASKTYVSQDIALPAAGTYKFTAWIKKNTDNSELLPYMFFENGYTNIATESVFNIAYGSFTAVTATFTVNAETEGVLGIGIKSGAGEIYIDDITVEKISDAVGDIVINGDFESFDSNNLPISWTVNKTDGSGNAIGSVARSSGTKHGGTYSMWIKGNDSGKVYLSQNVSFPSAGIYEMSFWICRREGGETVQPYAFFHDGNTGLDTNTTLPVSSSVNNNTFVEKTVRFTVGEDSLHNSAIGIGILSGAGQIYIDDVAVERVSDLPREIISNGGFEEYDDNSPPMPQYWEIHTVNGNTATGIVRRSSGGKRSGTYGLWMRYDNTPGSMYIYQNLNLTSAGTYRLKFYIRINKNYDVQPYVFFRDGNTGTDTNTIITNATSTYTEQTVDFTVGANSLVNSGIGIGIYSSSAGSEIYMDDVTIEKID